MIQRLKRAWRALKRRTVADIVDEQIEECRKALIDNRGTAEHYKALADGNEVTLARLLATRAELAASAGTVKVEVHVPVSRRAAKKPLVIGNESDKTVTPIKRASKAA